MPLKKRAFKSQGRVKTVDAAKQHGARLAFNGIGSFVNSGGADNSVHTVGLVFNGLPFLQVVRRPAVRWPVAMFTPPCIGADMLALSKHGNFHISNSDSNDVRIDCVDYQIQNNLLLTCHDVLNVAYHKTCKRLRGRKDKSNGAKDDDQEQDRKDQASSKASTPPAVAVMPAFQVAYIGAIPLARGPGSWASTRDEWCAFVIGRILSVNVVCS